MGRYVTVDGLTEAKQTLAALPEAFREEIADAIDVGSAIILSEAARRVPVRTGKLKSSLSRSVRGDGQEAIVGSNDFKSKFIEFGTNDTPAQPFLFPAFRLGAKYIRAVLRNAAEDAGIQARFRTKRRRVKA
jgi:HK97 gp10 family phage protein